LPTPPAPPTPTPTPFPYTTLFRSPAPRSRGAQAIVGSQNPRRDPRDRLPGRDPEPFRRARLHGVRHSGREGDAGRLAQPLLPARDRKSTRLNSSHVSISYAVFCLK